MSSYAIWFTHQGEKYRLPINPEEITETSVMAIEKYEVLKLGQIAVPGGMELREFSFEAEFPREKYHYVEYTKDFRSSNEWIQLFKSWRDNRVPILFTYAYGSNYVSKGEVTLDDAKDVSTYVLIEELTITDKAGEEGDKYIAFKLLEYRQFSIKTAYNVNNEILPFSIKTGEDETNPKSTGHHIVKAGDTLWAIAKKYYGDGSKYNIIFNANKDKIKNPSLIKVGWKLIIPDKSEFAKYNAPLPNSSKSKNKNRDEELLKMAADFAAISNLNNVAGIGSSNSNTKSKEKKIVIYESSYNTQNSSYIASTSDKRRWTKDDLLKTREMMKKR